MGLSNWYLEGVGHGKRLAQANKYEPLTADKFESAEEFLHYIRGCLYGYIRFGGSTRYVLQAA